MAKNNRFGTDIIGIGAIGTQIMLKWRRKKILNIVVVIGSVLIGLWSLNWLVEWSNAQGQKIIGLTYSPKYAEELRLDPRQTYLKMLDDLGVKHLRLPVYWDEVEKYRGFYNFEETDWYIREAAKRGVKINLVLGYKQPRWPECFAPIWAKELGINDFSNEVVNLVSAEVEHFRGFVNIAYWQVENEPDLPFGLCDKPDPLRLAREIEVVKSHDERKVIVTESGELTEWTASMKGADRLGISIYRTVWNPWLGLVDYPLPATFYSFKNLWSSTLSGKNPNDTFVAELQAEAWGTNSRGLRDIPVDELARLFPADKITNNLRYAKKTGLDEIYLWGVEWWYMMDKLGDTSYLEVAKQVFR